MKTNAIQKQKPPKKGIRTGVLALGALGILALAGGGYWLYTESQKKKTQKPSGNPDFPNESPGKESRSRLRPSSASSSAKDSFPLRKGSKGPRVKQVQEALIKRFGTGILPQYGADGAWGNETETALRNVKWPRLITQKMFIDFFGGGSGEAPGGNEQKSLSNPHDLAWNLHQAAKKKDWSTAHSLLSRLQTIADYTSVRKSFTQWPFRGPIRYTPVNALLSSFPNQRKELETHFQRIGLVKRGSKWELSALGLPAASVLRTLRKTPIWQGEISIEMPAGIILGKALGTQEGITEFENGVGERFFVQASEVGPA